MKTWPPKDPDEVLDYGFDWSPRDLGSDTIVTTTAVTVDGDVVVDSHGVGEIEGGIPESAQATVTWLSGGTAGTTCQVLLHALTAAGRELEETLKIKIKER